MSTEDMKWAFDVVQTLMIAVIGVMNWLNNRQRVTNETINRLETGIDERLDNHTERLTRVEVDIKNAPNHADIAEIYREMRNMTTALSTLNSSLAAQSATLIGLKEQVARMDSFWRSKQ
jgi:flagellar motility protein MotE (MotC chaperone)